MLVYYLVLGVFLLALIAICITANYDKNKAQALIDELQAKLQILEQAINEKEKTINQKDNIIKRLNEECTKALNNYNELKDSYDSELRKQLEMWKNDFGKSAEKNQSKEVVEKQDDNSVKAEKSPMPKKRKTKKQD